MNFSEQPPLSAKTLRECVAAKQLSEAQADLLMAEAEAAPDSAEWLRFLSLFLAFAGAAFCLSGIVFFFAYNWENLQGFAKIGLLELSIALAITWAWKQGNTTGGRALLLSAVILVGPLLAVYGQQYQTGADPYELFLGWAALTFPWVLLARQPSLWVTTFILLNIAFTLYWGQVLDGLGYDAGEDLLIYLVYAIGNLLPWLTWEWFQRKNIDWLTPRWPPRLMAMHCCGILVTALCLMIISEANRGSEYGFLFCLLSLSIAVGSSLYYTTKVHDLYMLAVLAGSAMIVTTVGVGRLLLEEMHMEVGGLFVLGFFIVAEVALVAKLLAFAAKRFRQQANASEGKAESEGTT